MHHKRKLKILPALKVRKKDKKKKIVKNCDNCGTALKSMHARTVGSFVCSSFSGDVGRTRVHDRGYFFFCCEKCADEWSSK